MTFSDYFYILEESLFTLPSALWKDIEEYYKSVYKLYKSGLEKKALNSEEIFPINFGGTEFSFLNDLDPTIKVKFVDHTGSKLLPVDANNRSTLLINLKDPYPKTTGHVIEHEIIHFIQELIQSKRKNEKGISDEEPQREIDRLIKSKELVGGLPSKSLYPKDITKAGYMSGDKIKKIDHHKRPVEYYPNVVSFMRQLQNAYRKHLKANDIPDSTRERENFFQEVYQNAIKPGKPEYETEENVSIETERINEIKEFSKKLYERLLSLVYKLFINEKPSDK